MMDPVLPEAKAQSLRVKAIRGMSNARTDAELAAWHFDACASLATARKPNHVYAFERELGEVFAHLSRARLYWKHSKDCLRVDRRYELIVNASIRGAHAIAEVFPWDPAMGMRERAWALYTSFTNGGTEHEARRWRYDPHSDGIYTSRDRWVKVQHELQETCALIAKYLTANGTHTTIRMAMRMAEAK